VRLGILINTANHKRELVDIARAAIAKSHEVTLFFMDGGVLLMREPEVASLASIENLSVRYCDYSAMVHGLSRDEAPAEFEAGSQVDNLMMIRETDKVISL